METTKPLPMLNNVELRVLGALIEKSKTTPDYYPMTLNALTAACNQKTSRKPVVDFTEETVLSALNSLKGISLIATAIGGNNRVIKYKHNFTTVYPLSDGELAILCLLLLRGAQTPGELNTNSGKLHEFQSLDSVIENLDKLITAPYPFVKEIAKRPGQKETRFIHLLGDTILENDEIAEESTSRNPLAELESRVIKLEQELEETKLQLSLLIKELKG